VLPGSAVIQALGACHKRTHLNDTVSFFDRVYILSQRGALRIKAIREPEMRADVGRVMNQPA
jgi:hypothetical protein